LQTKKLLLEFEVGLLQKAKGWQNLLFCTIIIYCGKDLLRSQYYEPLTTSGYYLPQKLAVKIFLPKFAHLVICHLSH
jgi:hypothetical protein